MVFFVKQPHFEGPLDLLLHLIHQNQLDICAIAISQVTNEYLCALDELRGLNLEVAGEYLVMAATLIHIKSRMLLPVAQDDQETEEMDLDDCEKELVQRLKEYQIIQEAALGLDRCPLLNRDVFLRPVDEIPEIEPETMEVDYYQFLKICREVLTEKRLDTFHQVEMESFSIAQRIEEIKALLASVSSIDLRRLFKSPPSVLQVVVTLLALLELVKSRLVRLDQKWEFGPIEIWPIV